MGNNVVDVVVTITINTSLHNTWKKEYLVTDLICKNNKIISLKNTSHAFNCHNIKILINDNNYYHLKRYEPLHFKNTQTQ